MIKVGDDGMTDLSVKNLEQMEKEFHSGDDAIRETQDFEKPEKLYAELIESVHKYHPSTDITLIEKAYRIADQAHKEQVRKSGEPYIIHPLYVAIILAELELDKETIVSGLLHDVVEDTVMTKEEIAAQFGDEVALLVDGVTKLGQLSYDADKVEIQAENLRKMFLAMAKDIRVILIKLADRLHNMRTLKFMKPEKQKEKARETMDIYAPIAQRLGISKVKTELDDLSLKYLEPEAYYDLVRKVAMQRLVHIGLRHRDIILKPPRNGTVHLMNNTKRGITVFDGIDNDPNGKQIKDLIQRLILADHLLIDAEKVLRPAFDLRLDLRLFDLLPHFFYQLTDIFIPDIFPKGNLSHKIIIRFRFQIFQRKIVQFRLCDDEGRDCGAIRG